MKIKRILIVDDNKDIRKFLSKVILKYSNGVVETASSVPDALEKFAKESYNTVITDINMPEISGFSLIRYIKIFCPDCKIVAMSADNTLLKEAKDIGASICLLKPFEISKIVKNL